MEVAMLIKIKNAAIQRFLDEKGWSQADLARELNVRPVDVGKWCNMQRYPHKNEIMFALCSLLNKTPEEIFPNCLMDDEWLKNRSDKRPRFTVYKDIDLISLQEAEQPYELTSGQEIEYEKQELKNTIETILSTLLPREEFVLKRRFGIDEDEMTLEEIGKLLGVSKQTVRVIESRALRKLQHPSRKSPLDACLNGGYVLTDDDVLLNRKRLKDSLERIDCRLASVYIQGVDREKLNIERDKALEELNKYRNGY